MTMNRRLLTFGLVAFLCLVGFAAVEPVASQKLELKPGWNLVTIQFPVVEADLERFLALQPMRLDAARKCFVRCVRKSEVKVGAGYWVYSRGAQTVELTQDQSQTAWSTMPLSSGWNLIGVASQSAWQGRASVIWQWLDGGYQVVSPAELTAGSAYWATSEARE